MAAARSAEEGRNGASKGWRGRARTRARPAEGGGTYTFKAFTLTLNDRDGRVWQINAYVPPGEGPPRPRRLVVNGRALVRD